MSQEILQKLDELKAGQTKLENGQQEILGRLHGLERKIEADYRRLLDLATGHRESIGMLTDLLIPPKKANG